MSALPTRAGLQLHGLVLAMAAVFRVARATDPRFRRALGGFRATYQFRSGQSCRQLLIDDGRIRTRAGRSESPDCEIVFFDLEGTIKSIRERPRERFERLSDNTIEQIGNKFFIFKLGYLGGLCERRVRDVRSRIRRIRRSA